MGGRPLRHKLLRPCWQPSRYGAAGRNFYHRLVVAVDGMEVRWGMVSVVHVNRNPVEPGDPRHDIVASLIMQTVRPVAFQRSLYNHLRPLEVESEPHLR